MGRADGDLWYVGVGLEILSTLSGTIGKQLIRLSETTKKRFPGLSKTYFHAGLIVNTVVGPVIDMGAYSFAAQSLIAPFGGLDVVWNAVLAPYILQEKLSQRRMLGCFLIVIGTGCAGAVGSHEDKVYTTEYIEDTLINMRVLLYSCVFAVWILFNLFFLMRFESGSPVRGISLGMTAGTIAGNMFCVKAAVEIIERSIHEGDGQAWLTYLPYLVLAGAVFFATSNVVFMTRGLQEYEALFMVTVYEGSMIVSGCTSGAVVLLDLEDLSEYRIGFYCISILVIVAGMAVVFSNEMLNKSSLAAGKASFDIQKYQAAESSRTENPGRWRQTRRDPVYAATTTIPGTPCSRNRRVDTTHSGNSQGCHSLQEPAQGFPGGPPPQMTLTMDVDKAAVGHSALMDLEVEMKTDTRPAAAPTIPRKVGGQGVRAFCCKCFAF